MDQYKQEFIEFMVRSGALSFGAFETKSGRLTPYFINSGSFCEGSSIVRLGRYYAQAINSYVGTGCDNLYGPAYKGIPLAVTTASALWELYKHSVTYTFNRKEEKDHGEKGALVGHRYTGGERVLIIEDVVTAGTSVRETMALLKPMVDLNVIGVIVSVDRQERGQGTRSALDELQDSLGLPTYAIVTLDEIIEHLDGREIDGNVLIDDTMRARIQAYRDQYGATA
jgi:orotate phosphoribosyltransferase